MVTNPRQDLIDTLKKATREGQSSILANQIALLEADPSHRLDLRETDLRGANLRWANLRETDLRGTDLRGANMRETDLRETDLHGANLHGAKGLISITLGEYNAYVQPDTIRWGCQTHPAADWWSFTDEQWGDFASDAIAHRDLYLPVLRAAWEAVCKEQAQNGGAQ